MTSRVTSARSALLAAAVARSMGLSGARAERLEETSLGSRIVDACATYAEIASERRPKSPRAHLDALEELRESRDDRFDPVVVNALADVVRPARAPFPR